MPGHIPVRICDCGARPVVEDELASPAAPTWSPLPGERKSHHHHHHHHHHQQQQPHEAKGQGVYGQFDPYYGPNSGGPADLALAPGDGKCWCLTLRQGCIGISVLFIVIGIGSVVLFLEHPGEHEFQDESERTVHIAYRIFAVMGIVKLLFSIMLLIGILREMTGFVKPWLISYFIVCPLEATAILTAAFVAMFVDIWPLAGGLLIAAICYIGVYGFCLYVVYRYYILVSDLEIVNV